MNEMEQEDVSADAAPETLMTDAHLLQFLASV